MLVGKPSFTKKQADLFFPPDFADDFPVAMQVSKLLLLLFIVVNSSIIVLFMNLLIDRYPRNTIWSMWSPSLDYYLFMTWRPLLQYIEIELVQIQYFWQRKLDRWEVFMLSIGVDRCYWLLSTNKRLCHLSVARYVQSCIFFEVL